MSDDFHLKAKYGKHIVKNELVDFKCLIGKKIPTELSEL